MLLDHTGYPRLILRYISFTFKQDDVFEYEDDDLSASGSDVLSLYTKYVAQTNVAQGRFPSCST